MAVASTMLPLGTSAPTFTLPDPDGQLHALDDLRGRPVLVMFICNHCPYVKHLADALASFTGELIDRGVGVVGISSNDADSYPDDSPEHMADESRRRGYRFPYLYDEDQAVAAAYRAACTPDFFLFDIDHRLVYRGQFDDTRPSSGTPPTGADLRAAVEALLAGTAVDPDQKPSLGCSIKWKPGNEPI